VPDGPLPSLVVKKRMFMSLDYTASSKAKSLQRRLDRQFPLRRFLVSPVKDPSAPTRRAAVVMSEGLPHKAQIVALLPPQDPTTPAGSLLMAMVVLSIPFTDRCRIFWNMVSAGHTGSMSAQTAYGGDCLVHLLSGTPLMKDKEKKMVDPKVRTNNPLCFRRIKMFETSWLIISIPSQALELIPWSITQQITSEISFFCCKAPWPDPATNESNTTLSQLPLVETLINTAPPSISSLPHESLCLLNTIFPPALGVSAPLSVGQWLSQNVIRLGNRKRKVRNILHRELGQLLQTLYGPEDGKAAVKNARKLSLELKRGLARMKKENPGFSSVDRAHEFCNRQLAEIISVPRGSGFVDLGDLSGVERAVHMSAEELAEKRRLWEEHMVQMERDRAWSEEMLADMVSHL